MALAMMSCTSPTSSRPPSDVRRSVNRGGLEHHEVFGLIEGPTRGRTSPSVALAFASAVVFAGAFTSAERRQPGPAGRRRAASPSGHRGRQPRRRDTDVRCSRRARTSLTSCPPSRPTRRSRADARCRPSAGATAVLAGVSGRPTEHASARTLIVLRLRCAAPDALLFSHVSVDDRPASLCVARRRVAIAHDRSHSPRCPPLNPRVSPSHP
jgi:hypothetical protein